MNKDKTSPLSLKHIDSYLILLFLAFKGRLHIRIFSYIWNFTIINLSSWNNIEKYEMNGFTSFF